MRLGWRGSGMFLLGQFGLEGELTNLYLEKVLWRSVDLVEALLAGIRHGLHGGRLGTRLQLDKLSVGEMRNREMPLSEGRKNGSRTGRKKLGGESLGSCPIPRSSYVGRTKRTRLGLDDDAMQGEEGQAGREGRGL
jgi:hypothetical protein